MKTINYILGLAIALAVFLTSCDDDNDPIFSWDYTTGIVVVEEGTDNGSISVIDDNMTTITNNAYALVNGINLGKYVQSFTQIGTKGYIIENGAGKMSIVDLKNLKKSKFITDLSYPRYVAYNGTNTAFISNGNGLSNDDCIFVFDTESEEITDTISTRIGPNAMEFVNNKLFVLNFGGWSTDSFMTVINTETLAVEKEIELAKGPADLVIDANNNIWVICSHTVYSADYTSSETTSTLFKINGSLLTVELELNLTEGISSFGSNLLAISPDKKTIYLEANGVMAIDYNATSLPTTRLIDGTSAYGLSVDPDNGNIWVIANNTATVYDNDGNLVTTYPVGTYANAAVFLD